VPRLQVRWSEHEARKPYARPFGVTFVDDSGTSLGGVAVSGADLLYYQQFKGAVLALTGEIFGDAVVDAAADQQRAWLDVITLLTPAAGELTVAPASNFDSEHGRIFRFTVARDGAQIGSVDAATLLEYQEFQAAVAHQSGLLYRAPDVEAVEGATERHLAWERALRHLVSRPESSEAMAESWPWR
jgi:hypothetical protein